jgi:6,7-dimethyl-8-ribityllumazine synthase
MKDLSTPQNIRPPATAGNLRFAVVVSRFNSFITERLLTGTLDALAAAGAPAKNIEVTRVPGSFEIPLAAKKLAEAARADAIIAIGCVLRGETAHFDYVANEVARGVQLAQLDTGVPIIFCVLTCDTLEQAIDRAGLKGGNKGREAGVAAVEMANLARQIKRTRQANPSRQIRPANPSGGGSAPRPKQSRRGKSR